jgi:hypothetical protein
MGMEYTHVGVLGTLHKTRVSQHSFFFFFLLLLQDARLMVSRFQNV